MDHHQCSNRIGASKHYYAAVLGLSVAPLRIEEGEVDLSRSPWTGAGLIFWESGNRRESLSTLHPKSPNYS
jgi:hypothetical protein